MSNNTKAEKNASETEGGGGGGGGGGGKSRGSGSSGGGGGKLARRARSFKEDFLEILSQMRSPSSTGGGSPHSPKARASSAAANHSDSMDSEKNPVRELEAQFKQVQYALKHFRDVVSKNKLEVLPGNGTVVLETVTNIHSLLKTYVLDEQSSALVSATSRVHQSVARLIKLCDDVLLHGEEALDPSYVQEVIHLVEEAAQNLVTLAQDKLTSTRVSVNSATSGNETSTAVNVGGDGPVSHSTPRNDHIRATVTDIRCPSLPDIPLTPRERLILEQTSMTTLENHRSSGTPVSGHGFEYRELDDSDIDGSPPPKPPLPGRFFPSDNISGIGELAPPPLPPKRRQQRGTDEPDSSFTETGNSRLGTDILSRSPEDTSSLLSASAGSLDSVLNHSRGEEEIQALMDPDEETTLSSEVILPPGLSHFLSLGSSALNGSMGSCCCWERDPPAGSVVAAAAAAAATAKHERLSSTGDSSSGFASMHSLRSSTQSYTASSSVQMTTQHTSQQLSSSSVTSSSADTGNNWLHRSSHSSHTSQTMTTTSTTRVSSRNSGEKAITENERVSSSGEQEVPALPSKTRSRRRREVSQYDNVPDQETWQHSESTMISVSASCSSSPSHGKTVASTASLASLTTTSATSANAIPSTISPSDGSAPPPLPLKKKHIMAYMEMFGNCSQSHSSSTGNGTGDFMRHSVAFHALSSTDVTTVGTHLSSAQSCSFDTRTLTTASESTLSPLRRDISGLPPALPPKRNRQPSIRGSPRPTTPPQEVQEIVQKPANKEEPPLVISTTPLPPAPEPVSPVLSSPRVSVAPPKESASPNETPIVDRTPSPNPLDELEISRYLVLKRNEDDGPEIRGGHPDALIILATKVNKNDFIYQEAFLTTYRTYITPVDLIDKLCYRQRKFQCASSDIPKQRAARETFSLLVRVVNDLTVSDLDDICVSKLMDFVYQLLCSGDLTQAKALRVKILEKYNTKRMQTKTSALLLPSLGVYTRQSSLLEFKPEQIAEQMTLLDRNLFIKIEIPEVLIWAREQNEERSPHLTRFTEHFNKMSYWARSRILEQAESKDRERYVVKFIKIMKHLRKLNNFNSYLALLSALDSAPIRRLEWHKHITEGLKEYCALIDSSSSFRAYRQALADTQPPCIPYIGLVLQDLTFVHIGNNDLLADGSINFSKRWQQYHIVENMKRFQKGEYNFKRHDRILAMFNNFDDFLCEEAMWQISETIKPRGARPPAGAAS